MYRKVGESIVGLRFSVTTGTMPSRRVHNVSSHRTTVN
jgi:hypothetical protein